MRKSKSSDTLISESNIHIQFKSKMEKNPVLNDDFSQREDSQGRVENQSKSLITEIELYLSTHYMILDNGNYDDRIIEVMDNHFYDDRHPLNLIHQHYLFNIFIGKLYDNEKQNLVIKIFNIIVDKLKNQYYNSCSPIRLSPLICFNILMDNAFEYNDIEMINMMFKFWYEFTFRRIFADKFIVHDHIKNLFILACQHYSSDEMMITLYNNIKYFDDDDFTYQVLSLSLPEMVNSNNYHILDHTLKERYFNEINNNIIVKYLKNFMFNDSFKLPFDLCFKNACSIGNVKIIDVLMKYYQKFCSIDRISEPINFKDNIIIAARNNHVNIIQYLTKNYEDFIQIKYILYDPNHRLSITEIKCAFSVCCHDGSTEMVLLFLNLLSEFNFSSDDLLNIINKGIKYAINSSQIDIIQILLTYQKDNNIAKSNSFYNIS